MYRNNSHSLSNKRLKVHNPFPSPGKGREGGRGVPATILRSPGDMLCRRAQKFLLERPVRFTDILGEDLQRGKTSNWSGKRKNENCWAHTQDRPKQDRWNAGPLFVQALTDFATIPCADSWRSSGSRHESSTSQSNFGGHERPWQTSATGEHGK